MATAPRHLPSEPLSDDEIARRDEMTRHVIEQERLLERARPIEELLERLVPEQGTAD
jgi:hypothetical protein